MKTMNTVINEFKISKDFSETPGPRFEDEGAFSGEILRKEYLLPRIENSLVRQEKLRVDLDGTHGYLTSFLEEAFGGLIRENRIPLSDIDKTLIIISTEEPYLLEDIKDYLQEAHSETRNN